eukprot:1157740-Pelagomonas_calceolata.AAC.1
MSGEDQLSQRSDGVVIKDSACHTQVSEAMGAESGNGTCMLISSFLEAGHHLRVEMGGFSLDRAHKNGIGTALMPGKGASAIGNFPVLKAQSGMSVATFTGTSTPSSWSFSFRHASMATRNESCTPLLRASQQRLKAVLCLFMDIPWHVGCDHPGTIVLLGISCASAIVEEYRGWPMSAGVGVALRRRRKQILYPEKHRHHVQGDILETMSNLTCTPQVHSLYKLEALLVRPLAFQLGDLHLMHAAFGLRRLTFSVLFFKLKPHAGIAGNESADNIVKCQASLEGCQCPVICNTVTERYNIASRMILKVASEGSYRSNFVRVDAAVGRLPGPA